jgi:hypothetical protein
MTTSFRLPPGSVPFSVTEQCPFICHRETSLLPSGRVPSSAIGQCPSPTGQCHFIRYRAVSFRLLPGSVLSPLRATSHILYRAVSLQHPCYRAVSFLLLSSFNLLLSSALSSAIGQASFHLPSGSVLNIHCRGVFFQLPWAVSFHLPSSSVLPFAIEQCSSIHHRAVFFHLPLNSVLPSVIK